MGDGEETETASNRELEMLICGSRFAPSCRAGCCGGSGACQGAHRTKKDKKEMSQFAKFVAEGNEKADELAKAGAMLDEGFCGGNKNKDNAAREGRGARSVAVCSQLSLSGGGLERL